MKKVLYVILGLLAVYLILCFAGPSEVKVERSTEINAPAEMLKAKMVDFKFFHDVWSPWTEKDPGMKVTHTGETGQPGNTMAWESDVKEVGKGSMTYKYTNGDTIMEALNFDGQGEAQVFHIVTPTETGSKVTWQMQNTVPFMMRGVMLFLNIDKMVGPDFENGLAKLKTAIESMPAENPAVKYDIQEMNWDAKTFIGKKELVSFDKMNAFFGENYGKIGADLGKAKVTPIGPAKALYYTYDFEKMQSECAAVFEVANGTKVANWEKFETPAGKVLMIAYTGPYSGMMAPHMAMDSYMKEKGMTQSLVVEEYLNDPMIETDSTKLQTNIYYLIK